jgi:hypothetical protein
LRCDASTEHSVCAGIEYGGAIWSDIVSTTLHNMMNPWHPLIEDVVEKGFFQIFNQIRDCWEKFIYSG